MKRVVVRSTLRMDCDAILAEDGLEQLANV